MIELNYLDRIYSSHFLALEGELLDVSVSNGSDIPLGAQIITTIDSTEWNTHVLRKDGDLITLLLPISREIEMENRRYPRYNKEMPGFIAGPVNTGMASSLMYTYYIQVHDVSANGFGFTTKSKLDIGYEFDFLSQDTELGLRATIVIRNRVNIEDGFRYGAEITSINPNHQNKIRRYCLCRQLSIGKSIEES